MRIRMNVDMSGTRNGRPWPKRGEIADLPSGEAMRLCASGIAEEVAEPETRKAPPAETAVAPPAEVATVPEPEKPAEPAAEKRGRGRPRKPRATEDSTTKE
jgi:hypothetical protein